MYLYLELWNISNVRVFIQVTPLQSIRRKHLHVQQLKKNIIIRTISMQKD